METRSKRRSRHARISSLLASLVQVLVDTGLVNVSDVGKLTQTCREVIRACMEESLWASLCQQEWPTTADVPESCLDARGYRWMYRLWCGPVAKRRPPTSRLGPPSCTVSQLQLHLNVKYKDTFVFSKVFTGHDIPDGLWLRGADCVELDVPFSVGKAQWSLTDADLESSGDDAFVVDCPDLDRDAIEMCEYTCFERQTWPCAASSTCKKVA